MSRPQTAHVKESHMRETPKSLRYQSVKKLRIGQSAGKARKGILRDLMLSSKEKVKSIRNVMVACLLGLEIALPSASAVGANSYAEGAAFTYASGAAYQPVETRRANRTQIFLKTWKVSGTIEGVGKYGRDSEWAMRKLHAMKAWKIDVEVALLDNSASGAGGSGSARTMNGMRAGDRITATANATSTLRSPIDEGNLNSLLQAMWDQGVIPDRLVCGSFVKRGISQFAGQGAGRPIIINNGERVFTDVVDIYESDFGRIQLIASRRLNIKSEVLVFQNNLMGLAFLRPPTARPTPNDGDFLSGVVVGELTFEYLNAGALGGLLRIQSA